MDKRSKAVNGKIENLAKGVVGEVGRGRNPALNIPSRSLGNVRFDPKKQILELGPDRARREFFNIGQVRKFMQTFLIASGCRELLKAGKTTSIRDLYYMTKHTMGNSQENTFNEQDESDPIIEDLEVTLDVIREELNLFASNRGALVGEMTLVDSGDTIDCSHQGSGGWSVPSIVEEHVVRFKRCAAKFVLMVEKDAVWRRLNEDKFWRQHHCILVHGQGMASRGVRRLLYRLRNEKRLPVYVFVDNDPWGFYIYSVIKQGSINLAHESRRMAVPDARYIGLSSFDRKKYRLPDNVTIKLSKQDKDRARQILKYPWFKKKRWQEEIREMLRADVKLELEALSAKGISFVSEKYLPGKLKKREWVA